jgi:hypothetical protein
MADTVGKRGMRKFWVVPGIVLALYGVALADTAPPPLAAVTHALIGVWQSTDDTRFSREFRADGTAIDRYEGDPDGSQSGAWLLFAGSAPPPEFAGHRDFVAKAVYLEIRENGDIMLFGVTAVDRSALQMINIDRGNTLSFNRIQ